MTYLTQAIADVMFQHLPSDVPRGYVDHVAAVVVAEIRPTITTVAELDALPNGTVVRCDDAEGIGMNVAERQPEGWQHVGSALWFSSAQLASDRVDFSVLFRPVD